MKHTNIGVLFPEEIELMLFYSFLPSDKQKLFCLLLKKCKDGEISSEEAFNIMNDWTLY